MSDFSREASTHFQILERAFKEKGWKYSTEESKLKLTSSFRGDDLSIPITLRIDDDRQLIRGFSVLPFNMSESKRVEGAVATTLINWRLVNGSFDYDMSDGQIVYRIAQSYRNCTLSTEVVQYLVNCLVGTVDDYNDTLLAISKGSMDLQDLQRKLDE